MHIDRVEAVPEILGVPRYTPAAWPRWEAALSALQMQAQLATAALPGNPLGIQRPSPDAILAMRAAMIEHDAECKYISRMLSRGLLGEDCTIPALTAQRLRFAWMAGGIVCDDRR